jgi:hypothetical protein
MVAVVPLNYQPPTVNGANALPDSITSTAVFVGYKDHNDGTGGVQGGPTQPGPGQPPPPPPPENPAELAVVVPSTANLGPITGTVTNLANPDAYKAVVYVQSTSGQWYGSKPAVGSSFAIRPDGTFTLADWGGSPADSAGPQLAVFILPAAVAVPNVLGGPLPAELNQAVAGKVQTRAQGQPAPGSTPTATATVRPSRSATASVTPTISVSASSSPLPVGGGGGNQATSGAAAVSGSAALLAAAVVGLAAIARGAL